MYEKKFMMEVQKILNKKISNKEKVARVKTYVTSILKDIEYQKTLVPEPLYYEGEDTGDVCQ